MNSAFLDAAAAWRDVAAAAAAWRDFAASAAASVLLKGEADAAAGVLTCSYAAGDGCSID